MPGPKYVLTGFGDFLEQRSIEFVEPLPSARICSACGSVPSLSVLLPCGHVLCVPCEGGTAAKIGVCFLDGWAYAEADVVRLHFDEAHLKRRLVRCFNIDKNCIFVGELYGLKEHLPGCIGEVVKCTKCGHRLAHRVVADHYKNCRSASGVIRSVSFIEVLGDIQKLVEDFQGRMADDQVDKDTLVCEIDRLLERLTWVQQELLRIRLECTSGDRGDNVNTSMNKISAQVPYRCASKSGCFVTLFTFADLYNSYDKLQRENDITMFTSPCALGGYTVDPDCCLTKAENGKVYARFFLYLREGPWDGFVEWPFKKEVTVVLTHPTNSLKDVKLSVTMNEYEVSKKPALNTWNRGIGTSAVEWAYIERHGFISNGNLYINIELQ